MRGRLVLLLVAATAAVVPAAGVSSSNVFGDGTHVVGKDIRPGTYRARGGDGCYWARLRSFSGGLNSILANANPAGPTVVTILRTDRGFETRGCGIWGPLRRVTKSKTRFGPGTYVVNLDLAPGTYRSRGGDGCYWARLRAFTGGLGAIIANDNPLGSAVVTIGRGDRGFESSRCGPWTRL
jgi:hypothetical protein